MVIEAGRGGYLKVSTNISCLFYPEDGSFNVYQNGISSVQDAAKLQNSKIYIR
jgi:hypothetical protein